jgi:hypothetical protein
VDDRDAGVDPEQLERAERRRRGVGQLDGGGQRDRKREVDAGLDADLC